MPLINILEKILRKVRDSNITTQFKILRSQLLFFLNITRTEEVHVAVTLKTRNQEVLGSNLGSDIGYHYLRFSWFSSIHLREFSEYYSD
jgi:hypothetical protein